MGSCTFVGFPGKARAIFLAGAVSTLIFLAAGATLIFLAVAGATLIFLTVGAAWTFLAIFGGTLTFAPAFFLRPLPAFFWTFDRESYRNPFDYPSETQTKYS